jgi:hypothetical protein
MNLFILCQDLLNAAVKKISSPHKRLLSVLKTLHDQLFLPATGIRRIE